MVHWACLYCSPPCGIAAPIRELFSAQLLHILGCVRARQARKDAAKLSTRGVPAKTWVSAGAEFCSRRTGIVDVIVQAVGDNWCRSRQCGTLV